MTGTPSSSPDPGYWRNRRVVVTGGRGFLGSFVVRRLEALGASEVLAPGSDAYDLVQRDACRALFTDLRPDVVLHLAARVGGIGANQRNPGRFFFDNLAMGMHLIEEGRRAGLEKFLQVGTVCSYPKYATVPFKEEALWDGYPEETNAPYGIAKKALLVQLQAYREQYDFDGIYLIPVNLYGPRDNFDLETSHVIPALIRKCLEAGERGEDRVTVWGTGRASREFLFVDDCAQALLLAAERYDGSDPVNIGTGHEVTIRELATTIARLTGFDGELSFDTSRPDGQPRRCLDTSRAAERFGFRASTTLDDGLARTIEWYRSHAEPRQADS